MEVKVVITKMSMDKFKKAHKVKSERESQWTMTRQLAFPRQISRIKDLISKNSKDWSEECESNLEFNEPIGSSRRKIESK